ncbi:MAG TPA: proline--tRNA ligase [Alphaproteobacteria bacterium]|nr:proline--tRNA ligase [Alphaproteobacteria bacterium]
MAITTRKEDFSNWFQDVIKEADLACHSVVRGCMIFKPTGYALWESLQKILDKKIKETGHQNVYFPLLIPLSFFEKEAKHVEGFAKECAVVTHYRLEPDGKGGLEPAKDSKLAEPLVIRPTSEAIIGEAISSWIQSYKDLPVLINQWCNVMRWEMRTKMFLRTSEFLWQEGHTAHATREEAEEESLKMLEVYEDLAHNYLAIPVLKGEKTPAERFPGAVNTYTIETMMQDGKALQAGTSHFLGQNFSKAYDITYADKEQKMQHAWTTSWGVTTRLIGALIMTHSDDFGLVLPPKMAPDQVVIIPIVKKNQDKQEILGYCEALAASLRALTFNGEGIRVKVDASPKEPVDKFWDAVKKGIPVRLEIGPRDKEARQVSMSLRNKEAKDRTALPIEELLKTIPSTLENIQQDLYNKALNFRLENSKHIESVGELETLFSKDENYAGGFAYAFFDPECESQPDVEAKLKELKVTTRCLPFENKNEEGLCIFTKKLVKGKVIFAKSY